MLPQVNSAALRFGGLMASDRTSLLTHPVVICLLAMVCCALWGSAFPCIKIGYRLFAIAGDDAASQIVFAGIRFILAGIINFIIGSVIIEKPLLPRKKDLPAIFALKFGRIYFQAFYQVLIFCLKVFPSPKVQSQDVAY